MKAMRANFTTIIVSIWILLAGYSAVSIASQGFNVIPIGVSGGIFENNLSSYLLAPTNSNAWVALDAGTLCSGIKNISQETLKKLNIQSSAEFFTSKIKAYLISHAHLDHISGLVICSTADSHKIIYGLKTTIDFMRDYIFNWKIWPNFADEGYTPLLKQYHYNRLPIDMSTPIKDTILSVEAFPLSHGNHYLSTAFLLKANNQYLLYFGDTGADNIEHSQYIQRIWQKISPLIRKGQLRAIFVECSYTNDHPDAQLMGHLKPDLLLAELRKLANLVNKQHPHTILKGLPIVVTHIKQGLGNEKNRQRILQQLRDKNDLGVLFIEPKQGKLLSFTQ